MLAGTRDIANANLRAIMSGVVVFTLLAAILHFAFDTQRERAVEERRAQVTRQAVGLLNRLEAELNANVFLASGLIAYITAVREINAQEIGLALQALHEMGRHIRNIGLAPGNRITHVYPLEGNRAAVGLYYPQLDEQWPAVKKAIDMRQTVLAGPVELRQGGSGLISRTPVFLRNGDYWGLLSIVLDTHSLLDAAGMAPEVAGTRFALRGSDASGASGAPFLGDSDLFHGDPVTLSLAVPGGAWQLAARPRAGWQADTARLAVGEIAALAASLLLAYGIYAYQRSHARVEASERRLRLFMETTRDAVVVINDRGVIQEFTPAAERLFGYAADEIVGDSVNRLMATAMAEHHDRFITHSTETYARNMTSSREVHGRRNDGGEFPIEVTVSQGLVGEEKIHVGVVRDISERKAFEQRLVELATTDELTGALNRRAFLEIATDTFRLARRHDHPLSVLLIDMDDFKTINDRHGHAVGDSVLKTAVETICHNLRETDKLGRFGGEEFVVLLPETDCARATEAAGRLLDAVRALEIATDDGALLTFTMSIGVASVPPETKDLTTAIRRADQALYQAKANGRDRYEIAD